MFSISTFDLSLGFVQTHACMFIPVNGVGSKALSTSQPVEGGAFCTLPPIFGYLIIW